MQLRMLCMIVVKFPSSLPEKGRKKKLRLKQWVLSYSNKHVGGM